MLILTTSYAIVTLILSGLSVVESKPLAGNEAFALTRRNAVVDKRSDPTSSRTAYIFSTPSLDGQVKEYLSPIGDRFQKHVLTNDWGIDRVDRHRMAVTVFDVEGEVDCTWLTKAVTAFQETDDVWDPIFMEVTILQTSTSFHVAADVPDCLAAWGGKLIVKKGNATSDVGDFGLAHVSGSFLPQGPYLATIDGDMTLTRVYRSYQDSAQAFTSALIPTVDGTFVEMAAIVPGMNTLSIPVPSRLYNVNQSNALPLAGKRVGVKDIYDIAGTRTGCGNRAYWETYAERDESAVSIQRLIDLGAAIVGKAKTSTFANGESATADWVDQMAPFNPRGDGYQQPSSSSSGPGAAIAAYPWLDVTIGSDTGCSILCPSGANGVYGMRPTWGAMPLDGVMPLEPVLDTAGFLCRDPEMAAAFSRAWYGDSLVQNYTSFPKTLHFPAADWTFSLDSLTASLYKRFRQALTDLVRPTNITDLSDESFWNATGEYSRHNGTSVADYLGVGYGIMIDFNQWNNFGQPWFADYAEQNDQRKPFVSPSPETRWAYGRINVTRAMYDDAVDRKQEYKAWFEREVLRSDEGTCSDAIYVTAWTGNQAVPAYRNVYQGPPSPGLFGYNIFNYAGIPQLNIPIGQVPYNSTISGRTEYLPVSVGLNAAVGCDYVLWDLAAALKAAGAIDKVQTGKTAYPIRT